MLPPVFSVFFCGEQIIRVAQHLLVSELPYFLTFCVEVDVILTDGVTPEETALTVMARCFFISLQGLEPPRYCEHTRR